MVGHDQLQHQDSCAQIEKKQLQLFPDRPRIAVHGASQQNDTADLNSGDAEPQSPVRRTADLSVQAVGNMPPVVEAGRGQHHDSAPGSHEGSERRMQSPNFHGDCPLRLTVAESRAQDQISAGNSSQNSAAVDEDVWRDPEVIVAYRLVPREVPIQARTKGRYRGHYTCQRPGHRARRAEGSAWNLLYRGAMINGN